MNKNARKVAKDPSVEALLQKKDKWNKGVSGLIDDLIHFKKLVNGWNNKFYNEKSKIKNPIPASPEEILHVIINNFSNLTNQSLTIVEEQKNLNHSKTIQATLETPFIVLASNKFTKIISKLRNILDGNNFQTTFLNLSEEIDEILSKVEVVILSSSNDSIYTSVKLLERAYEKLIYFRRIFNFYKKKNDSAEDELPQSNLSTPNSGDIPLPLIPELDEPKTKKQKKFNPTKELALNEYNDIIKDFISSKNDVSFDEMTKREISFLIRRFTNSQDIQDAQTFGEDIKKRYNAIVFELNSVHGTEFSKLSDFIGLSKIAGDLADSAKKMLGKLKHTLVFSDNTSAIRMEIYNSISEIREVFKELIDGLTEYVDVDLIESKFVILDQQFKQINELNAALNALKLPLDNKNKFRTNNFDNELKTYLPNYDIPLDGKERSQLDRLNRQKFLRELLTRQK